MKRSDAPPTRPTPAEPPFSAAGPISLGAETDVRLLRAAIDTTAEALMFLDRATLTVLDANRSACEALGLARPELIGASAAGIVPDVALEELVRALDSAVARQPGLLEFPVVQRGPGGTEVRAVWRLRAVPGRMGPIVIVAARPWPDGEVGAHPGGEALRRMGGTDALTGLPDRRQFERRLARALADARRRPDYRFAVLFADLDGFKAINDRLGHLRGDRVLCEIAGRMAASVRPGDLVARFGGDEFTVFLDGVHGPADAQGVAQRIQERLHLPVCLEGETLSITVSVGIVLNGPEHDCPEHLLHDADRAMYRVKRGRSDQPAQP